jgi:hypothetical protein
MSLALAQGRTFRKLVSCCLPVWKGVRPVIDLPKELALLRSLFVAFSGRTRERFVVLTLGAIVAMGRRTVSRVLWAVSSLSSGHASSYHRFFSSARWSLWTLARVLAAMVFELAEAGIPIVLIVDDTVVGHRGNKVFGKGWHRDPINSSCGYLTKKLGHKWVVMAVNVKLPWCKRPWALPVMAVLYRVPPKLADNGDGQVRRQAGKRNRTMKRRRGKKNGASKKQSRSKLPVLRQRNQQSVLEERYKSPCLLARQMLAAMIHWFPDRQFILLGDGGFASHELALFCYRHRRHVRLIARFCPDARLHTLPSGRLPKKRGPKRIKGLRLPAPQASVAAAKKLREATLPWYGQSRRNVQMLSACAGWYRCRGSRRGAIVPIRWVFVRETLHQTEAYLYSTDPTLTAEAIIAGFASRWSIEVTFQEVRAHLGFATPRQRCRRSVLRTGPCLLGLFSLVSLIYARLAADKSVKLRTTCCYGKNDPTFADALAAVRRVTWEQIILPRTAGMSVVTQLAPKLKELLLDHLTAAA